MITSSSLGYVSSFPVTENPISEGSKWQRGSAEGLSWQNPQIISGRAVGTGFAGAGGFSQFDDNIAHLKTSFRTFRPDQYVQATAYVAGGYNPGVSADHESELLLRFTVTANSAKGYEILQANNRGVAVVRWNGPLGDYTEMKSTGPVNDAVVDGDVLRAQIIGNIIQVYQNGVDLFGPVDITATPGNVYNSGQPGMGFYIPNTGATVITSYGWKNWIAGDL